MFVKEENKNTFFFFFFCVEGWEKRRKKKVAGLLKGMIAKLFIFEGVRAKKISNLVTVSNPGFIGLENIKKKNENIQLKLICSI